MILIISEQNDVSTDIVCDVMNYRNIKYLRINRESNLDCVKDIWFSSDGIEIMLKNHDKEYNLNDFKSVWFRRGYLNISNISNYDIQLIGKHGEAIKYHMWDQAHTLLEFIYKMLMKKRHINDPFRQNINKLEVLSVAQEVGLLVPSSLITCNLNTLSAFTDKNLDVVTKDIREPISYSMSGCGAFSIKTKSIIVDNNSPKSFWYSFFQKQIKKKIELRIFYLNRQFFTAALFSQSLIDYRENNINGDSPTRIVPYKLPTEIKKKLNMLMKKLDLVSGSIDMIVDEKDLYWFLEVNPVGQYDHINKLCNFTIEESIVKYLNHE